MKGNAPVPVLEGFDGGERVFVFSALAVHDGVLVCSMIRQNELLFVDVRAGKITKRLPVPNPRGMAFDAKGAMHVLSGKSLLRFDSMRESTGKTLITGLEDPRHVALDQQGHIYI